MAKKEKKPKKEKKKEKGPDLPYAGSERMKGILTNSLIVLSVLFVFLAIYTIVYCRQSQIIIPRSSSAATAAAAAQSGNASGAKTISYGTIWFSMPDGTFVQGES